MSATIGKKSTLAGGSYGTISSGPNGVAVEESHGGSRIVEEFREQVKKLKKGLPFSMELSAIPSVIDALKHHDAIDDRKLLLEHLLTFMSQLPEGSFSTSLQNAVVELLYSDLPHPAGTYVGTEYSWRSADGSGNNLSDADMGKANTPYSRSVQQLHPLPANSLPDPGLIFDTLLRREKFTDHPAGLSSLMFAFAALVIHTVFRTSHDNVSMNETSSYIDLAPLYGSDQAGQDRVRMRNGRGHLYPDTFAEDRLLLLPPAVSVLLVCFSRNHNYIADKILELNERGFYVDPDSIPASDPNRANKLLAQEEDIFQTARLCNIAWFGSAVFSDYFSAILGLVRQGSSWSLNPFGEIRDMDHSLFERGRGNVVSVEFNCLYRWHPTTSAQDEKWVEALIQKTFNKNPDDVTLVDMKIVGEKLKAMDPDCSHWSIGQMERQKDGKDQGKFKDEELADVLYQATTNPAHAFGAKGTPGCMRLHEIMGIMQSRKWGVCSLNDFRRFLGLKPYSSFLEWNPDPEVAAAAEKLYGDIERLELYAGLQAEQTKPVVEGAGLCPPYTISRAILADAIALTRGDRFFTADYTPHNMTAWGFADCQRDPSAPGYGSTLGRLLLRTLPRHYAPDSVYTWFPLMTPTAMGKILGNLGEADVYAFERPGGAGEMPEVGTYPDAALVLGSGRFGVPWAGRAAHVIKGDGFFIASRDAARGEREQRAVLDVLTSAPGALDAIAAVFYDKTREWMVEAAWGSATAERKYKNVDVARDVLKYVPLYWACEVAGIKLKSKTDAEGLYTPQELYGMLTDIYSFLFLDFEHWRFLPLSQKVRGYINELLGHIKNAYGRGSSYSLAGVVDAFARLLGGGSARTAQDELKARFAEKGIEGDELANAVLAVLVGSTVEMSEGLVNAVNLYLDDAAGQQLRTIGASGNAVGSELSTVQGLVLEALREFLQVSDDVTSVLIFMQRKGLDPPFRGVYREAIAAQKVGTQSLQVHDHIFVNIAQASLDPDVFPNPKSVNPNRQPMERYLVGDGVTKCLGTEVASRLMAEVLRGVFSFKNIQRAPRPSFGAEELNPKMWSGTLKRYKSNFMKTSTLVYLDKDEKPSPWSTSMVLQYE
ncbi:hypothetical protein EIP86_007534 [Pleurotus ostreatoroseus]|nr:hypothetical protein EIP86_007534 [Pleurotus ostreatoroseus]